MECVERTQAVAKAMAEKKWELAVQLRGKSFARNLETYKMLTRLKPPKNAYSADGKPIVKGQIIFLLCIYFVLYFLGRLQSCSDAYRSSSMWYECGCSIVCKELYLQRRYCFRNQ